MAITAQMVKELREITGAGPLDSKKALEQFDGDIEKAVTFLREKGLAIPRDIRLVGYDNTFIASIVRPSLTTIDVPKTEMGRLAASCLIERAEGRSGQPGPRAMRLPAKLVVRETTDPDAESDWALFDW